MIRAPFATHIWCRFTGEVSRTHHQKIIETFKNVKGDRTSRIYERVSHARWWNQRQAKQRDDDDDTKIKSVPSLHDVRGPFRRRSQGYVRRRTNESPRESQICKAYMRERIHERACESIRARARVFSRSERAFKRMQRQLAAYKRDVVFSTPRRSNASPLLFLQGCVVTADVSCCCLPIARSRRWLVISDGKFVRVTPAM